MAATVDWPKKARGPRPVEETIKDLKALREAREGGLRWHGRFGNMTKADRAEALKSVIAAYARSKDYAPAFLDVASVVDGDREYVARAAAERRIGSATPDADQLLHERRVEELRDVARAVLGPHYGTDKYPEFRPWTDALDLLTGRRHEMGAAPGLSPHEEVAQRLPAGLGVPYRIAMRGTRNFLMSGAIALRTAGRAAGLVSAPLAPGGPARASDALGQFIERQAYMSALDEVADQGSARRLEARGMPKWAVEYGQGASDLASQAVGLSMGSAAYGHALPFVFGAGAAAEAYDDARAKGVGVGNAVGRGLLYGGLDTALWMTPMPWAKRIAKMPPRAAASAMRVGGNVMLGAKGMGSYALNHAMHAVPGPAGEGEGEGEADPWWGYTAPEETRQDWGGGDAMTQMDELARPEYAVMGDWGEWAGDPVVRPAPTWRTVTLRGRLLPEDGTARDGFPYEFYQNGTISPEGVPYLALDPREINANARALDDGTAVTTAGADLFSLSEKEKAEFDRLTREGKNPGDRKVRMLRAMLAAGERSRDDVKALAWAERKNRDIAMAKEVARAEEGKADNWQDYYVPTSAGMTARDAREAVAGDIGRHVDWLRGNYERRAAAGDGRGSERAMDRLKAFRKKAQYLARRYGLHPELAKLSGDKSLWNRLSSGQREQRMNSFYPRDLYVETGHYLVNPSPLARERDYGTARKLLDAVAGHGDDATDEIKEWAGRYRDRTRRWSVWDMPYAAGDWAEDLDGNFSIPVGEDGNALYPAPEWLTKHVKRRRKRR